MARADQHLRPIHTANTVEFGPSVVVFLLKRVGDSKVLGGRVHLSGQGPRPPPICVAVANVWFVPEFEVKIEVFRGGIQRVSQPSQKYRKLRLIRQADTEVHRIVHLTGDRIMISIEPGGELVVTAHAGQQPDVIQVQAQARS